MDILEEAAAVAHAAERDTMAGRFAEMLMANPNAAFVFIMMSPTAPGLASLAQWTNADAGTLFWMLKAASHTVQQHFVYGDDAE